MQQADILLTTLNARYMHSAFALRYLYANLAELKPRAAMREFTIHERAIDIVEKLLALRPKIIGFSVYIWNVEETTAVIGLLSQLEADIKIVVGGPEVGFPSDLPALAESVNYIISGPGEKSFHCLCQQLLSGQIPLNQLITGQAAPLDELNLPYQYYNEDDIRNRLIYVEASRGCPFKCEFCLSALDKTARPFELGRFLDEMKTLHKHGARNFKFIDRTFNLKVSSSVTILEFFLERMSDDLYLHFEVIPDQLPELLKNTLVKFPQNSLQLEIGVQTFDKDIQSLISRKQDNDKTRENLIWLRQNTGAHIHADLIFGLPGDSLKNFADSFNQLVELKPQEIQLGILKRLRGAPINRHNEAYQLRYNPVAPYNILSTKHIDFATMQRVTRFARFWDMLANSGRFRHTLPIILGDSPFQRFLEFSDSLYRRSDSTWKISLRRQFELTFGILTEQKNCDAEKVRQLMSKDFERSGEKGKPPFAFIEPQSASRTGIANKRQKQHL